MAIHNLPTAAIAASPNNPRKHFNDDDLNELALSIQRFGVMQPIIVRPDGDGYELVCGERRLRASRIAGMEEIPAIVRELTDDEAFDLQITENLQRKDINPMEESDAFFALTLRGKSTAATIAKRFGKSEKYVYDRLALQRCILEVQDIVRAGTLPISHGKQFAQLNMDDQQQLWERLTEKGKAVALSDIKQLISSQFSLVLDKAPFNINNPGLVPKAGACTSCPKRSGCNQLLFDDVSSKDICFDKTCYEKKVWAHIEKEVAELQATGMEVKYITSHFRHEDAVVLNTHQFDLLDKDDENYDNHKLVGIYVAVAPWDNTHKAGDVVKITVDDNKDEIDEDVFDDDEEDDESNSQPTENKVPMWQSRREFRYNVCEKIAKLYVELSGNLYSSITFRKNVIDEFDRLPDGLVERLSQILGWEQLKDEDGDFDLRETVSKAYDNDPLMGYNLLTLAVLLQYAEDITEIADIESECFKEIGLDTAHLVDEWEKIHISNS